MSIKLLGVLVLTGFIMSCTSEHESFVWPSANADPLVFSPLTGSEEKVMRNSSIGNEQSYLSVVGDPVGPEIDRIFNSGYMHYVGGDYENAQILANYTLFHAAKTGTALTLVQLNEIFVLRAYALADSDRIEQAMAIHYYWLDVLKNEGDWERKIPDGLKVIKEIDQDVRTQKTAVCYQEIAIGQTILRDFEGAWANVVRAVDLFKESNDFDWIEKTLAAFIINSSSFEAWEYAIRGFEKYQLYTGEVAMAKAPQYFKVLFCVVGAYLNLDDFQNAYEIANGMVFHADSMGYSDEGVVLARQLRDQLVAEGYGFGGTGNSD